MNVKPRACLCILRDPRRFFHACSVCARLCAHFLPTTKMALSGLSNEALEEIDALKCIYPTEMTVNDERIEITLNVGNQTFTAIFTLPTTYPAEKPPACSIEGLDTRIKNLCRQCQTWQPGDQVIFEWMDAFRAVVEENPLPSSPKASSSQPLTPDARNFEWKREIFTSDTVLDRKSRFIARATTVYSASEVDEFKHFLLLDKHIAKATHPVIYAFRISQQKGDLHVWNMDCDDDGEDAAGGRLLHLLQVCDVKDAVVVVSRWFGGIQLGPDRFKHISRTARQALELGSFIARK